MTDIDESRIPTPDPSEGAGKFEPDEYDVYKDSRVLPGELPSEHDELSDEVWRDEAEDG